MREARDIWKDKTGRVLDVAREGIIRSVNKIIKLQKIDIWAHVVLISLNLFFLSRTVFLFITDESQLFQPGDSPFFKIMFALSIFVGGMICAYFIGKINNSRKRIKEMRNFKSYHEDKLNKIKEALVAEI